MSIRTLRAGREGMQDRAYVFRNERTFNISRFRTGKVFYSGETNG
jgi:hypothetical protein